MGNAHSSHGTMMGSLFAGVLLAPFTGGASLIPAIVVAVPSGLNTVAQIKKDNIGNDDDFFQGLTLGMTGQIERNIPTITDKLSK